MLFSKDKVDKICCMEDHCKIDYGFKILVLINMLLVRHHELLIGGGQLLTGPAVGATGGTGLLDVKHWVCCPVHPCVIHCIV